MVILIGILGLVLLMVVDSKLGKRALTAAQ
jgi:hypothetical protein